MANNISNQKLCKTCDVEKDYNCFYKNSKSKDGYLNDCKDCVTKKMRNKYVKKNKKDDEFVFIKQKFQQDSEEYYKKIILIDDPDEIEEINEKYQGYLKSYVKKLREKSSTSQFNIVGDDEILICCKIQEFLMKKKIMILPNEIVMEKNQNFIKVSLPKNIKLSSEDIKKINKSVKISI